MRTMVLSAEYQAIEQHRLGGFASPLNIQTTSHVSRTPGA